MIFFCLEKVLESEKEENNKLKKVENVLESEKEENIN